MWKEKLPEKIPYSLTEKYLLTKAFTADGDTVRFVIYDGFKDAKIKKIHPYSFDLTDDSKIDKIQILLAFPTSRMEHLKSTSNAVPILPNINCNPSLKEVNARRLTPPQR